MAPVLTIGQFAKVTGVPPRTIRFYEQVGVLRRPSRSAKGYRQYTAQAADRLTFLRRARSLGLSLPQLRVLADAMEERSGGSFRPRLREMVRTHLSAVQQQIEELKVLQRQLERIVDRLDVAEVHPLPSGRCDCLRIKDAR